MSIETDQDLAGLKAVGAVVRDALAAMRAAAAPGVTTGELDAIGGHTDSRGSAAKNQKLSEARASSVRTYVLGKYPTLDAKQFTVKGYGKTRPIVPNTNDLNMAKNRRVEFVVQNKDVLKKEVEKRRMLQQNENTPAPPAPAPTPAKADSTKK